jgi:hypothetical protein
MSDAPLIKRVDAEEVLRQCKIWNKPAFDDDAFAVDQLGARLARDLLETGAQYVQREEKGRTARVISDLNALPEYRHGLDPPFAKVLRYLLPADAGTPAADR